MFSFLLDVFLGNLVMFFRWVFPLFKTFFVIFCLGTFALPVDFWRFRFKWRSAENHTKQTNATHTDISAHGQEGSHFHTKRKGFALLVRSRKTNAKGYELLVNIGTGFGFLAQLCARVTIFGTPWQLWPVA